MTLIADGARTAAPEVAPAAGTPARVAHRRRYLMCEPRFFTVEYAINPWMNVSVPVDTARAVAQWQRLVDLYRELGHTVELIDPLPGQPDMVFAANGGFTLDGKAYGARFAHPERAAEGPAFHEWFRAHGYELHVPEAVNEGEGDFMLVGERILAGCGFRSSTASHDELRRIFDREVVSLSLTHPEFYHLDVAATLIDPLEGDEDANLAYFPGAFDEASKAKLAELYPDAIIVSEDDTRVLGLNAVSDGRNVVIPQAAKRFGQQLRERGYNPIAIELDELLKSGGSVKCCTLELR